MLITLVKYLSLGNQLVLSLSLSLSLTGIY